MNATPEHRTWTTLQGWLLAAVTVLLGFLWESRDGFNFWDEGFLWYGAQRVVAGEVPIRDFMAYDPLRYYWCAAWMHARGDTGIMVLREAVTLFQCVGLVAGLAVVGRSTAGRTWAWWLLVTATIAVWMIPRHKLFDVSFSLILLSALHVWVGNPRKSRYLLVGLVVGVAAGFGRNHGLYGAAGSAGVMLYLAGQPGVEWRKGPLWWAAGVVLGYLPILVLLAGVPGFAASFWQSITFLFEVKTTNLPLPVPWPWLVEAGRGTAMATIRGVVLGMFFVGLLVYGFGGLAWLAWRRARKQTAAPGTVAAVCLTLPYAHFAFSRADVGHLAQGVLPFVLGLVVMLTGLRSWIKWSLGVLLAGCSLLVALPDHPGWQRRAQGNWVAAPVGRDSLHVTPSSSEDLALVETLTKEYAGEDRAFYTAPYWPGAYAAKGRRSPVWEIYALFPRGAAFEAAEVARLRAAAPAFVVLLDFPLDGREELRFARTHPLLHNYVREHYEPAPGYATNPSYQVFRPRVSVP